MIPKLYLAPMAGYTDAAMRDICAMEGAQMCVSEMVSAKSIVFNNVKTYELIELGDCEKYITIQLFGHDPVIMGKAATIIEQSLGTYIYAIDINMGCPMPKIVNNGDGCALMKDIVVASEIVKAVRKSVNCKVSIKIRKGFDENSINAIDFARMAENEGCEAITIHGRTRPQYYSGNADLNIISDIKAAVNINVIGNGDIFCGEDALNMLKITGCDGVMVGRAAIGNPFIFGEISAILYGKKYIPPSLESRANMCLMHALKISKYKNERIAMLQMRRISPHYIYGFHNSSKYRKLLSKISNFNELKTIMQKFLTENAQ